ncbi:MAG: arginine--tRNA ligase [Nanoarchaeota archaeon]
MKEKIITLLAKHLKKDSSSIISLLEVPQDPTHGDYAFPCFILAKEMKKNPVQIAQELANSLKLLKEIEKIEAKGPYLNFFINRALLAQQTLKTILKEKEKYGSQKIKGKVVIEFPSPNTNKPLHLGHARNIVLGQAVTNLLNFVGNDVQVANLYNDRGVHICKSMVAYEKFGKGESPEKAKSKTDHFVGDYYVKFTQEAKDNKQFEEEAQECLKKWESGDKKTRELWKKMNSWAFKGFEETYKLFDLKIKHNYYESNIYNKGKEIVFEGVKKGIVKKKEDGAFFIDLTPYDMGEKILLRADGTSIYTTQDIYLALLKYTEFKFDKSLYVSASEQNYHFKALFKILELLGYSWAKNLTHLSYGMVNLESGRMKSREGNVVDSDNLISDMKMMANEEIEKRHKEIPLKEKEHRSHTIVMAALRYYFLKVDRTKDVTFKPEESLKFEGDTGPYLLYTYARAQSILSKAKSAKAKKQALPQLSDKEKQLIIHLTKFPQIVQSAYASYAPNLIANYSYQLAQSFNEFYHSHQVIGSPEEAFRLKLVQASSLVLKNSLSLLGIPVLEKM